MPERLYSTQQVANLLGATPTTVLEWIRRGWLSSERLPEGSMRVSESGLVRFLKDRGVNLEEIMARTILREARQAEHVPGPSAAAASLPLTAPARAAAVADPPTETLQAPAAAPEPALSEASSPPPEVLPVETEPEADEPPQAPEAEAPPATEPIPAAEAIPSPEAPSPGDAVAQVVEAILADAVRRRASAIHLEPQPDGVALRLRIDGVLHPKPNFKQRLPKGIGRPLVARLKELANLDVSEGRRPQAGTFSGALEGRDVEFRLTTFPMLHGEKAVLKVVDREAALPTLDTLGFSPADLATVRQVLAEQSGLVLVMAPPRSHRRTTLRAMIAALSSPGRSIVAVEDTIDLDMPEVAHAPVASGQGLSCARAVRALCGQDGDIVMVGEIRDRETARAVVDAAAGGCLVLAALPSRNETPDPTVLLAAGVEPMALASTLLACIVQRSARRLCQRCKVAAKASPDLLKQLGYAGDAEQFTAWKAKGCPYCSHVGYDGRTGLFSVLRSDEAFARVLLAEADGRRPLDVRRLGKFTALRDAALDKVGAGITSLEEAARVLGLP